MGQYKLVCPVCGGSFEDKYTNFCPTCGKDGPLLKAKYQNNKFEPLAIPGFWKFLPWLPVNDYNNAFEAGTVVYESTGSHSLAKELGLKKLYIAFNGYWPEKNAKLVTCTFKELEAPPTFQRLSEAGLNDLVIASAGNTAKAFINAARFYNKPLFVVVPYSCRNRLVLPFEVPENVTVIACNKASDYSDSIKFAARMTEELNLTNEGGARNIARRAGMGTVLLEGVLHMDRLPTHYFQAIGSGTGAIAVLEASELLLNDGGFGNRLPKLHLSQNQPFTPMVDAWKNNSNKLIEISPEQQKNAIAKVYAKVLTNRHPPYSTGGGIFDILQATNGLTYPVSNEDAIAAGKLFEACEGIDLVPAASVAVGSLIQAVDDGKVNSEDVILMNITGGGEKRLWEEFDAVSVEPDVIADDDLDMQELNRSLGALHGR